MSQRSHSKKRSKEEKRRQSESAAYSKRQQDRVEEVEQKLKATEDKLDAALARQEEEKKLAAELRAKRKAEHKKRKEERKLKKKQQRKEEEEKKKKAIASAAALASALEKEIGAGDSISSSSASSLSGADESSLASHTTTSAAAAHASGSDDVGATGGSSAGSHGSGGDEEEEEAPAFPTKYAIVGGGPTAFNAMKEILYLEPDAEILMISEEDHAPYDRSPMSKELFWQRDFSASEHLKYPNWRGEMFDLEYHPKDFYTDPSKKITLMSGRKVTDLDAGRHLITLDDGTQFHYQKCLLAVGTTPLQLDLALPEESDASFYSTSSVSTLRTAKDFLHLHKTTLDPNVKHITVIGNDYLAADLVDALVIRSKISGSGTKVAQVFPDEGVLASIFPTYYAQYLTEKTKSTGVDVHPAVHINSITSTPESDHKLRINLDDTSVIDTDHIVLSLGGTPNVDLARKAYLEVDDVSGGIAVNAELEARTDLYVAGDAASYYDGYLGRRRVEGIDHAEISGKVAGLNMTGKNKAYTYQPIRWGAVSQNVSYQSVGLVDSKLDMVGVWQKGPNAPLVPSINPDDFGHLIPDPEVPLSTEYEDANQYERGVIYYMDGPQVVGVMMINVNGQMDVAKRLITFPRQFEDPSRLRTQIYLGNKPKTEEEPVAAPL